VLKVNTHTPQKHPQCIKVWIYNQLLKHNPYGDTMRCHIRVMGH